MVQYVTAPAGTSPCFRLYRWVTVPYPAAAFTPCSPSSWQTLFPSNTGRSPRPSCQVYRGLTALPSPSTYTMPCIWPVRPTAATSSSHSSSRAPTTLPTMAPTSWMRSQGWPVSRKLPLSSVSFRHTCGPELSTTLKLMVVVPISIPMLFMVHPPLCGSIIAGRAGRCQGADRKRLPSAGKRGEPFYAAFFQK